MARACIINVNDRGKMMLEKLMAEGRIKNYKFAGNAMWCFEFDGVLEISIDDYLFTYKDTMLEKKIILNTAYEQFKKYIVLAIARTLRGGALEDMSDTYIIIRSTEKTETICFRVTPTEKKMLEEAAREQGKTISDYIRSRLGL